MHEAPSCLVLGSINIDEFYTVTEIVKPGQTISSTSFCRKAGGKGANQAYAVAQSGAKVSLDGCIGPDGVWIQELLQNSGVDVKLIRVQDAEVTGRAIIQISAEGENSIVLHKGANYALRTPSELSGYSHLLVQNEIPLEYTIPAIREAKRLGLTTVFNPSPMLTKTELAKFPLESIDWLLVNEGELEELIGSLQSSSSSSAMPSDPINKCLAFNKFPSLSSVSIICTLGSKGLVYMDARDGDHVRTGHQPCGRLENPVKNTTGAGDCFTGYFVSGLMSNTPLENILERCVTACALCVERDGAMESIPGHELVLKRLASMQ